MVDNSEMFAEIARLHLCQNRKAKRSASDATDSVYLVDEYLVTPFVPSEMACLASSPGRMSLTEVWISRDEMVDFLLYDASLEASDAMRSKMSLTKELRVTEC